MVSLRQTTRPLEPVVAGLRSLGQGWAGTSQPFTTVALTSLVRAGAGTSPDRRRHARGGVGTARFTSLAPLRGRRCPRFLSPSNKALATASFPSGMVDRFPEAPNFVLKPKGRAFRRLRTMFNDVWAALLMSRCPSSTGAEHGALNLFGPE